MRPLLTADILMLARALVRVPKARRQGHARSLLDEADAADDHRLRTGFCHSAWGDGSVAGRLFLEPVGNDCAPGDPAFLDALSDAARALARFLKGRSAG